MIIYIDSDYKCHVSNLEGIYREVETEAFDGKCDVYIEGYRFIPTGETWTRSDGMIFQGEMIIPWKDRRELDAAQTQYELDQISAYNSALLEIEAAIDSPEASGDISTFVEARKQAIITRIDDIVAALETMEVTPE